MQIEIPKKFQSLFTPSRYKAFYGGRGSAKSHSFATALVNMGAQKPLRILCGREIQKSIKDSVKRLIDDKIRLLGLSWFYESTETEVRGKNGTLFIFAGLKMNIESIKSMEGIDIFWGEEASYISQQSLDILIPTIRKENSELWFSWNPENELDPVDMMFRAHPLQNALVVEVDYHDNPFFPKVLKDEADQLRITDIEKYNHIWRGAYNTKKEGAYYAKIIAELIAKGRITHVSYDPNALVHTAWDIGIGDSNAVWFAQFVGTEVHIIDYLESAGQPIAWYAQELRAKAYNYAPLILPHDGRARELGTGKTIEDMLRGYGYQTLICPNIHVKDGIEAVRNFLARCWFDSINCMKEQPTKIKGLVALQSYRENYDEKSRTSRGALHDENSHGADAFRYLAVAARKEIPNNNNDVDEFFDRYAAI
jgi:phage terminase large subunit